EARHHVKIREVGDDDEAAIRASVMPLVPATDARTLALERRITFLEGRIAELERELEEARSQVSVDIDFSDAVPAPAEGGEEDDVVALLRRLRHDPRDADTLHALYRIYARSGDLDRRFAVAQVLSFLGAATDEEAFTHAQHKTETLIRPTTS